MDTRVKVCCIHSPEEAAVAVDCGASAVGLVASMPSGPGVIEETMIASIARSVPPPIATFLLTSERIAERIAAQQRRCGTNTVQICHHVSPSVHRELQERIPGIGLVQVVHVESQASVDYALSVEETADALLLDSGRPNAATPELGGTGRTHDWGLGGCLKNRFVRDWERGGMRFETRGGSVFAGIRNRRVTKKLARPAPRSDELEFSESL